MGMTRIIAGDARGRKLLIPPAGTRPTSDRAREGLFSSLQVRVGFTGHTVLDLFAGSGALGLEAASRGADRVVLVEANQAASDIISRNITTIRPSLPANPEITVVTTTASRYLATAPNNHFTMVLADPPYDLAAESVDEMIQALIPHLVDGAMVVIERHRDCPDVTWPDCFEPTGQKLKKRTFGIARMDMAIYNADSADTGDEPQAQ